LKIDTSPHLSEKSSDFDEILYTAADLELDERYVIKNEKVALDRLRVRQNVFLVINGFTRYSLVYTLFINCLQLPLVTTNYVYNPTTE